MRARLAAVIALVTAFPLLHAGPAVAGDLAVRLAPAPAAGGQVVVDLYDSPETFREPDRARTRRGLVPQDGAATGRFADLPAGDYAIVAWQDADGDGELDRFLGMIPTEPYAVSNDPELSGPPQWEACVFTVPAEGRSLALTLRD